jgi:hypothetical protein
MVITFLGLSITIIYIVIDYKNNRINKHIEIEMIIKTSLQFNMGTESDVNNIDHNIVVTGLTYNHRTYSELSVFSQLHKQSITTLRRITKLVPSKRCSQYYLRMGNKLFLSDAILRLNEEAFSQLNEVGGNWAVYLAGFQWDYFGTIRYSSRYSLLTAKEKANKYFKKLKIKYKREQIRLFYTLESGINPNEGFHMHFVLWISTNDKNGVKNFTESHFRGNGERPYANTQMVKYDPKKGGIPYILKEIHKHDNDTVDFLTHNLEL